MLTLASIFKAQAKYGARTELSNATEHTTYEVYLSGCRRSIMDKTPTEYYNWDMNTQSDFMNNLILDYVKNNALVVEGYIDENGDLDQDALITRLRTDIVDFGILREALEDDTVQEVQINDFNTIWVVRDGKSVPFLDRNGKPYQFVSDAELHATIDRLIYNPTGSTPRMPKVNPLLNTRTAGKGYRL